MASDRAGRWYILHVKSRQEKALARQLEAMRAFAYLPLVEQSRVYGHRKSSVSLPLFAGYVFLKGEREEVFAADRSGRVVQVLEVTDQRELGCELAAVEQLIRSGAELTAGPRLERGTWVEVVSGPFRGQRGQVESLGKADRLWVRVNALSRAVSVELSAAEVEPLTQQP